MRVIVVGAGLAGLAATCRLVERGHQVVLVERSRLVGGKATSFTVDGTEVDNGQHVHLGCCTEYLDFVNSLGMSGALWTQPRFQVRVLRRGRRASRLYAVPALPPALGMLPSFATYAHLTVASKLQVARALRHVDDAPASGTTFGDWLREHGQGRAAIAGFWELFVVPALNAGLDEVSAADALFVVRTAFAGHPDAARVGWSRVPLARFAEAAARRAGEVHLRTGVVAPLEEGGEVRGVRCADGRELRGDAVVLAVPPARVAAILGDAAGYGVSGLARFRTRAIVDVHLWFEGRAGLDFAAIINSPVQWVFEKRPGYLCCSMSAADGLVGRSEADLVALCRSEVEAAWPLARTLRLIRGAATRDPEATFIPEPGLERPGPGTNRPNLVVAGAWTATGWPATMESAVRSGRAAAEMLVRARTAPGRRLEPVGG